eukprot:g873.t1
MAKMGAATGKKRKSGYNGTHRKREQRYEAHKNDAKAHKAAKIARMRAFKEAINANHKTAAAARRKAKEATVSQKCNTVVRKLGKRKRRAERMDKLKRKQAKLFKLGHGVRQSEAAARVKKRGTPIIRGERLHPRLQQVELALIAKRAPFMTQSSVTHLSYTEEVTYTCGETDDELDDEEASSDKNVFVLEHGEESFFDPVKAFEYIDGCWPKVRPLFPRRPRAKAHVNRWLTSFDEKIAAPLMKLFSFLSTVTNVSNNGAEERKNAADTVLKTANELTKSLRAIEGELASSSNGKSNSSSVVMFGGARVRTQAQMESRLLQFYMRHNPEKLSQGKGNLVKKACMKFVKNQEGLNKILREKYGADLDDIQGLQSKKVEEEKKEGEEKEVVETENVPVFLLGNSTAGAADLFAYPYIHRLHLLVDSSSWKGEDQICEDLASHESFQKLMECVHDINGLKFLMRWYHTMRTEIGEVKKQLVAIDDLLQPNEKEALLKYHLKN